MLSLYLSITRLSCWQPKYEETHWRLPHQQSSLLKGSKNKICWSKEHKSWISVVVINKPRLFGLHGNIPQRIYAFLTQRQQQVIVDGAKSDASDIRSGVPQGTVMEPLLFLLFIYDLPSVAHPGSSVRLFADDCLVYRPIKTLEDQLQLQRDLDAMYRWDQLWGMKFNAKKCHIMTITNMSSPLFKFYQLEDTMLSHVDSATYLGALLHKSLSFSDHVQDTANKCNLRLGFVRRNLRGCPQALKRIAYFSLVRSSVEYAATIWDLHWKEDQEAPQNIQNRAVCWVCGKSPREQVSVSQLASDLKWQTLEQRRKSQRLALMHKIVHGEVAVTPDLLGLQRADSRTRASHLHKFCEWSGRTEEMRHSFVNNTIREWNHLPAELAEADSLPIFRSRLSVLADTLARWAPSSLPVPPRPRPSVSSGRKGCHS